MNFIVTIEEKGQRLDKFLVEKLKPIARSQIQKMVKEGLVLVNDKIPTPHHFLKENDVIIVEEKKADTTTPATKTTTKKPKLVFPKSLEPKIIFEDKDFLVINKPTGILVHARDESLLDQEPTIVHWVIKNYPAIKKVGENLILRPGIVHRLDKEASGVMIIAKNNKAFAYFKDQFKNREVKKEYVAWVYGQLPKEWDVISFPIGRSRDEGKMAARPVSTTKEEVQPGKDSVTEYEVIKAFPHKTLVKVMPKTGRTHQIRVHFYALHHPLIGDPLYTSKSFKKIASDRMLLHAHKLTLKNLAGEEQTFVAPLPKEFKV
ncbi:MAG: RluA family pseudouridine synthase [Candidatus Magasanikbacteria bacterium]|nr:RluA family pseudouridine synthase [Candidatus Magasanikbacteria bacterium]